MELKHYTTMWRLIFSIAVPKKFHLQLINKFYEIIDKANSLCYLIYKGFLYNTD